MFDVSGEILYLEKVQRRSFWIPLGYNEPSAITDSANTDIDVQIFKSVIEACPLLWKKTRANFLSKE